MKRSALQLAISAALAGVAATSAQIGYAQEGLEEIVVTATRREQNLQEIPISIVAITGENLELQGLDSLEDVGNNVPNINIQGGGAGTFGPVFRVRGLPNIGLYVDGVWQVGTAGFLTEDFVDIDRVEVLRGPQGTTYGRDSVGGAVRIWTQRPGDELGGTVTATMGSLDRRDVKASLDVPVSDNLRTKWTAASLSRDGYIHSVSNGQNYGATEQEVFRGDIEWTPTDKLSFRLIASSDDVQLTEPRVQDAIFDTRVVPGPDKIVGTADDVQNWGVLMKDFYRLAIEQNPAAYPGFLPFTAANFTSGYPGGRVGKWQTASSTALPSHIQRDQTSLDINWSVTDNINVQFLSAYTEEDDDIVIDWDGSSYDIVSDLSRSRLNVFSEEIQVSGGNDRVDWVGGVYYWNQEGVTRADRRTLGEFFTYPGVPKPLFNLNDVFAHPQCVALANPATNPTGAANCQFAAFFAQYIFAYDNLTYEDQDGWAVFGEATVKLTDRLDLTVGVRQHDQSAERGALQKIPGVTALQTPRADVLHSGGDPFAGTRVVDPANPPVSFDKFTKKVALQMQFTDDVMGYVSYSEGFNSGGIGSIFTDRLIFFPYEPETIENTEIGVRADLADGKVRFNATYFDSDWLNIQNDGVVRDPNSGVELPTLVRTNVGTANASGVEVELTVVPTEALMVNLNLGLLDTGYTYIKPGTSFLDVNTEFEQAPDTTWSVGLQHTASLKSGGSLTSRIDYSYTSQFWRSLAFLRTDQYGVKNGGPIPANFDEAGDYGVVNGRITYSPPDGKYSLAVFGTNLTDEYLLNSGFFHGIWGYDFATVGRPREFGASLSFRF